jgi:tetratricopeptide (TPR) repeat protein
MYTLILISILPNLSEIRTVVYPYEKDIYLINNTLGVLLILAGLIGFLFRNIILNFLKFVYKKFLTPKDTEALVEYNKYFTEKELEKLDTPYVQRIENNIERNVIKEATDFLKNSEQVLIISGESGIGKTRLAIEISKRINESGKLSGNFKLKGKCLFVNLRHYKNQKDIEDKLNAGLSEKTVLIFDDYQYNMDLFNEIRNTAFKRNSKLIIHYQTDICWSFEGKNSSSFNKRNQIGKNGYNRNTVRYRRWRFKRENWKNIRRKPCNSYSGSLLLKRIPDRNAKEIFQDIITSEEFFDKIIRDFQKEYGEDFIQFLAGGELTGGVIDIPQNYEKIIIEMEKSGHISKRESKYHLTPDILYEYLINREFFTGTILKHSFEELAKAENGAYILEILNSIIKIKNDKEIYRKAAEKLLEIVNNLESSAEQKNKRIKTGIMVYEGFGNLNLVTERLGEFWKDYEILDDGNDLQNLGTFLIKISKPYEARKCLEKTKEIFTRNHDNVGISFTNHNLGNVHYLQGNYEEAVKLYNQSLKIFEELRNKSGIAGILHALGNIHYDQGNYEEAVKLYNQSLKINKELGDKNGIAGALHQLGNVHYLQGNYEEAVKLYNQSLKINKELGNKGGIASTMGQLGIIDEDNEEYVEALKCYFTTFSIFKDLKSPYRQLVLKDMNRLKEKNGRRTI